MRFICVQITKYMGVNILKESLDIIKFNNEQHTTEIHQINIVDLADNIFLKKYPNIAQEWHYVKNKNIKPWNVTYGSKLKVWWICPNVCNVGGCSHIFKMSILHRSHGSGCTYCNGGAFCYHNSLEYKEPLVAQLWHPIKNCSLKPHNVTPQSDKLIWFLCPHITCDKKCPHEFQAIISNMVIARKKNVNMTGCPHCSGKNGKVCEHLSVSYLYPHIVSELHPTKNKSTDMTKIFPHSEKKFWFLCKNTFVCGCEHAYYMSIKQRTKKDNPGGCTFCGHHDFCKHMTFGFVYPNMLDEWDFESNKLINPNTTSCGSDKKIYWLCKKDCSHKYTCTIRARTKDGQTCKLCGGSTEAILYNFLSEIYNVKWGYYPEWCKSKKFNKCLEFDFLIDDLKVIIELDGEQHFKNNNYFKTMVTNVVNNDVYKMICALNNGYSVVRLTQTDVRNNKNNWSSQLTKILQNIKFAKPDVYYIGNIDLYSTHRDML